MKSTWIEARGWRPAFLLLCLMAADATGAQARGGQDLQGGAASGFPVVCDEQGRGRLDFGFSLKWIAGPVGYAGILGGETTQGEVDVATPEGEKGRARVYANLISRLEEPGPSAWNLSIALYGDATLTSASIGGTQYPYGSSGVYWFYIVELVDPARNGGQQGAALAALPMRAPFSFPGTITATVLELEIEAAAPQADDDLVAVLRPLDGLQGSGLPVQNCFYVQGQPATYAPCNLDSARATLRFRKTSASFRRGDANGDGAVDISDPTWILNQLFHSGPRAPCLEAADANDDSGVDISDAIWIFSFLYRGGSAPRSPFLVCGTDPDGDQDGVTCERSSRGCPP